jgi:hypothetical protein
VVDRKMERATLRTNDQNTQIQTNALLPENSRSMEQQRSKWKSRAAVGMSIPSRKREPADVHNVCTTTSCTAAHYHKQLMNEPPGNCIPSCNFWCSTMLTISGVLLLFMLMVNVPSPSCKHHTQVIALTASSIMAIK